MDLFQDQAKQAKSSLMGPVALLRRLQRTTTTKWTFSVMMMKMTLKLKG
jgi:hypothetical protein